MCASPPPGSAKSIFIRGFQSGKPPYIKEKSSLPPGLIPEYAPDSFYVVYICYISVTTICSNILLVVVKLSV